MQAERFDRVVHALSLMISRRQGVAALLGGLASALPALDMEAKRRSLDAVASAPPPLPPPSLDAWPACSPEREHYCVEVFTLGGVDHLIESSDPNPEYLALVHGTGSPESSVADRLEWHIYRRPQNLQVDDLDKEIVLRIRSGLLEPVATIIWATDCRMSVTGDAASGWIVEIRGRPTTIPTTDEGGLGGEQATFEFIDFLGSGIHRDSPHRSVWGDFEGYAVGTNIHAISPPHWRSPELERGIGWDMVIGSTHLRLDGSLTHGAYRAWLAPGALQRLAITPEQAVAGDLLVTRTDDGVGSPVTATLSVLDAGVLIEIPDLTFSTPTISMLRRRGGACATKCKRGRICKNGRCVKKKKKHRKKHH